MELLIDEKWKLSKKGSKNSSNSSSRRCDCGAYLKRSSSMPVDVGSHRSAVGPTSQRSFSSRCARLVKEQRARFYIMRRCVSMLICWRDYP